MIYYERFKNEKINLIQDSLKLEKIPDKIYFGPDYKDYISNSYMGLINPDEGGSPFEYKYASRISNTSYFNYGSIIHGKILEGIEPELIIGDIPTSKDVNNAIVLYANLLKNGTPEEDSFNEAYKESGYKNISTFVKKIVLYENYIQSIIKPKENSYFIDKSTLDDIKRAEISIALLDNEINNNSSNIESFNELALTGKFNYSNNWKEEVSVNLPVKIKIDNFKVDHDKKLIVLNDLKTTSTRLDEFMDSSFIKFHYYRQFAFYGYLLYNLMARDGDYKIQANVYVLNKQTGSYKSFQINKKLVSRGFDEFQGLKRRIGFHESYGYDTIREDI